MILLNKFCYTSLWWLLHNTIVGVMQKQLLIIPTPRLLTSQMCPTAVFIQWTTDKTLQLLFDMHNCINRHSIQWYTIVIRMTTDTLAIRRSLPDQTCTICAASSKCRCSEYEPPNANTNGSKLCCNSTLY